MADFPAIACTALPFTPYVNMFSAIPFGTYTLVFDSGLGFLKDTQGNSTDYPHRALAFDALTIWQNLPMFFSVMNKGSGATAYIDFVVVRLTTDAHFIPTSIAGTPTGFRITRALDFASDSTIHCRTLTTWVGAAPDTDPYAAPMPLGSAVFEAMRRLTATPLVTPMPVYYQNSSGSYVVLFSIAATPITLT